MHEKLHKGLFFGFVGNVLFVAFGLICALYYFTYDYDSLHSRLIETIAYCVEFLGFGLLVYSDVLLCMSLRLRRMLKICYSLYIVLEALMMVLELNSAYLDFYEPYSLPLSIVHAVISAAACFAFLQLDPDNTKYEITVTVCIGMVLFGMLGTIFGVRAYFGVLINAVSFSVLFGMIRFLLKREDIEIDCYGDRARVAEYKSTMFTEARIPARAEKEEPADEEEGSEDESPVDSKDMPSETENEQKE